MLICAPNMTWMCCKALPALHKESFSVIFTEPCISKLLMKEKSTKSCQIDSEYFQLLGGTECLIWKSLILQGFQSTQKIQIIQSHSVGNEASNWTRRSKTSQGKVLSQSSGDKTKKTHTDAC